MKLRDQRPLKRSFYRKLPHPSDCPTALPHPSNHRRLAQILPNIFGGTPEEWIRELQQLMRSEWDYSLHCFRSVYEHFGINFSDPGAHRDIALSLAFRHERDLLIRGPRIQYSAICERYGVKPDEEDADHSLALALITKHVWGERPTGEATFRDWQAETGFTTADLTKLYTTFLVVEQHLSADGKPPAVRAVSNLLRDQKKLAAIIPRRASDAIHAILVGVGNRAKGEAKKLGDTRMREIIEEMRDLRQACEKRKYTPLQLQLLFAVWPIIDSLHAGQNASASDDRKTVDELTN